MKVKYAVSVVVTALILVAMFVSLARHFWLGVGLALAVDAGLICWGLREFAREHHIELRPSVSEEERAAGLRDCCPTWPSEGHLGTCKNSVMNTGRWNP